MNEDASELRGPHRRGGSSSDDVGSASSTPPETTFTFQCRRCGSMLEGTLGQCGRRVRCPTCGVVFGVPDLDPRTGLPLEVREVRGDSEEAAPVHAYAAAGAKAPTIVTPAGGGTGILCPRCGRVSALDADHCPECGLPFTIEGTAAEAVTTPVGLAWACLLLGVLSVLTIWCWIGVAMAAVGLIVGWMALSRAGRVVAASTRVPVIIGMLCSAAALVIGVVRLTGLRL